MKKTLKGIVCLLIFAVGFYFGVRVGEHMTKQKMAEILNVTKVENSTKENKVGVSDLTDAKDDKKEAKAEVDDNTIYENKNDENPRVHPKDLEFTYYTDPINEFGQVCGHMTLKNNSNYIIKNISIEAIVTVKDKKETVYYTYDNSLLPGETTPDMETFGSEDMQKDSMRYIIYDKESGLFCNVNYDFKTELCSMSPWYK